MLLLGCVADVAATTGAAGDEGIIGVRVISVIHDEWNLRSMSALYVVFHQSLSFACLLQIRAVAYREPHAAVP